MKVAVYSGKIPSTTFIERLIEGLSKEKELQIYLFGRLKNGEITYRNRVVTKSFKNTLGQILLALSYRILFFLKPNLWRKFKTARAYKATNLKEKLKDWGKVLPVVYSELDIFHLQWAKDLSNWIFLEELDVRVICSLRGAHINYSPLADDNLARSYQELFVKCSGFHAVSKAIMTEASQYGEIKARTEVIYSGLDLQKFTLKIKPKQINKLKIVSIGRAHWVKGYHYALDACKLLKDRNINFSYLIVGGETEELQYQVHDLNLASHVNFKSRLSISEVKKNIGDHDLLLLPSVGEGIANVVLESMALGTLVVSTDCGGMSEVIRDGENGFLVPIMNSEAIASRLEEITTMSEAKQRQICTTARQYIEQNHQEHSMITGMLDLYKDTTRFTFKSRD
ncbi:glycosyltransferase family 4 protein [Roseivirga sp. E12]|uniref:glycosyltransferase family 4 protein n=1 Tax=Roseivirga sp. E12 TaxID=2819237 RepID=UPI001ABD1B85|nr:glycosyltransferase family 4 protein [Roseivirga sp. E12]